VHQRDAHACARRGQVFTAVRRPIV
jgi:hypothetical protein